MGLPSEHGVAWRGRLVRILVAVGWIVIFIGMLRVLDGKQSIGMLTQLDTAQLLPLSLIFLLLVCLSVVLRGVRWWLLMQHDQNLPLRETILIYCWVFFLKSFTPMRSGELLRALWAKKHGGSAAYTVGTIVIERLLDILAIVILVGLVALAFGFSALDRNYLWFIPVAIIVIVLSFALAGKLRYLTAGHRAVERPTSWMVSWGAAKVLRLLDRLLGAFEQIGRPQHLLQSILITIVIWLLVGGAYYVILNSYFPSLSPSAAYLMILAVNVVAMVGAAPANIGSYEAAGVLTLMAMGAEAQLALAVVIATHALILLSSIICGVIARVLLRRQFESLTALY